MAVVGGQRNTKETSSGNDACCEIETPACPMGYI